ncbi:MAG TPA: DUF4951 domain-containing protein [Herpetosiphonaceae bacterium]
MTISLAPAVRRREPPSRPAQARLLPGPDCGDCPIRRLPVPAIPCGLTLACFGQRVLCWSTGSEAARRRIASLTREELLGHGVTCAMAAAWRDFYLNEIARNPRNPSAPGRVDLLRRVVALLAEGAAHEHPDRDYQPHH